ncbi:hypothetical protein D3C72_1271160 [compost metagenome]
MLLDGALDVGFVILFVLGEGDRNAAVQESHLAEARGERVVVELERVEDRPVGLEVGLGAGLLDGDLADHLDVALGGALGEAHAVNLAVALDLHLELGRQRVHDADAHAVEAARDLVAAGAELAAGVKHGQHGLERRLAGLGVHLDGDAAAVVRDLDRMIGVQGDVDMGAEAGQRLVDRVVDHLVHQVVKALLTGAADVHARALADGLEALEHLNLFGTISARHAGVEVRGLHVHPTERLRCVHALHPFLPTLFESFCINIEPIIPRMASNRQQRSVCGHSTTPRSLAAVIGAVDARLRGLMFKSWRGV